jgi:DNA repair exonuclease SbcCD ATPase subunit
MADPINATIKTVAAVTTQAYDYGSKVKHAKEDIENINRELVQVGQVLEKLKALAEKAERSGQSLEAWPTLIELNADDGPLAKCNQSLLDLKSELAPVSGLREKWSQKAKWPQKKEKVEKSLQAIVKEKNVFLEMLNVDHM